jgi:hypothetical protein
MKILAKVVLDAAKEYEESWSKKKQEYTIGISEAVELVIDQNKISMNYHLPAYLLLKLAWNDALDWANEVFLG